MVLHKRASAGEIRRFAFVVGAIAVVIFGILPLCRRHEMHVWLLIGAAAISVLGCAVPEALRPLYAIWLKLAAGVGWINTRILLGIVYYVVICPVGFLKWLVGKNAMNLSFDPDTSSYRISSQESHTVNLEVPF